MITVSRDRFAIFAHALDLDNDGEPVHEKSPPLDGLRSTRPPDRGLRDVEPDRLFLIGAGQLGDELSRTADNRA